MGYYCPTWSEGEAMEEEGTSRLFWVLGIAAGLLFWVVIPLMLFIHLTSQEQTGIGLKIGPSYNGQEVVACGEAAYEHIKVRVSTKIREDNIIGELRKGELIPILESVKGDAVYGRDDRWAKVWWKGTEGFVYLQLLREREADKCLPKRSSANR